jgi:hypothetical protein
MLRLLNVGLLVLAFSSTVDGFGGETWIRDETRSLFKRVTRRGWIFLGCVLLTLVTGIAKDSIVQSNSERQSRENAELRGQIRSQVDQIKDLRSELRAATATISDTRARLVEAQTASRNTAAAIQSYVYDRLSLYTARFLDVLSNAIEEASDGWLPANEKEFFSRRSVDLICRELNTDKPGRVSPPQPWAAWFAWKVLEYKAALGDLLRSHGAQMDTSLINAVSHAEGAATFSLIPQWTAARLTSKDLQAFPPLLCHGNGVEDQVEKDFASLATLYAEIKKGNDKFRGRRLRAPLPRRSGALGRSRFSPEELSKWERDHGFSTSGR